MPFVSRDKDTLQRILRNLNEQENQETQESKLTILNLQICHITQAITLLTSLEEELKHA